LKRQRLFSPIIAIIAILGGYVYLTKHPLPPAKPKVSQGNLESQVVDPKEEKPVVPTAVPTEMQIQQLQKLNKNIKMAEAPKSVKPDAGEPALKFKVVDGLAVVDADIVLGEPTLGSPSSGMAAVPELRLWESSRIPYYIQPSLVDPSRVIEAISMFSGSAIQLVPYQEGDQDVLVFENGNKDCKSYLGKVGGKQPIWLDANCGAREIAHEIMHALGFIHEQNRSDRDAFVQVNFDNVEEGAEINFELFPQSLMTVSGTMPFDFESIMIYPATIFARSNNVLTMQSKVQGRMIVPASHLTRSDLLRLERAYGNR